MLTEQTAEDGHKMTASHRFQILLPRKLFKEIKVAAEEEGVSIGTFIKDAVKIALDKRSK